MKREWKKQTNLYGEAIQRKTPQRFSFQFQMLWSVRAAMDLASIYHHVHMET